MRLKINLRHISNMNVFGSSVVEETKKKIVTHLEITNKSLETKLNMLNLFVDAQENRIKT